MTLNRNLANAIRQQRCADSSRRLRIFAADHAAIANARPGIGARRPAASLRTGLCHHPSSDRDAVKAGAGRVG